jgi:2-polyprenyl-3-methyl-5-hydroxy-6-metoxy-1,4-benzoquinol methylase
MLLSSSDRRCPACSSTDTLDEIYEEGTIYSCPRCRLQWARRNISAIEGAIDITGVHQRYMDPLSIDPANYEPYSSFFTHVSRTRGEGHLRMLDIGAGNGMFMAEAARRGHEVFGIEVDERHRSVIPSTILPRVEFAAAEAVLPRLHGIFDVITFWDSFEHFDDPFSLLKHVRPRLAPGGIVFARVNNRHDVFNLITAAALKIAHDRLGRSLLKVCFNLPQHAWNFSGTSMKLLLDRHGWAVLDKRVTETPISRLTVNPLKKAIITAAYLANRTIGGGKIGEYYFVPDQ